MEHVEHPKKPSNVIQPIIEKNKRLTQPNLQQALISAALTEMAASCEFQRKEKVCGETNQLSFCCYTLLGIWEETLDDNHDTKQYHPPDNAHLPHQQTFG